MTEIEYETEEERLAPYRADFIARCEPLEGDCFRYAFGKRHDINGHWLLPEIAALWLFKGQGRTVKRVSKRCKCNECVNPDHLQHGNQRINQRVVIENGHTVSRSTMKYTKLSVLANRESVAIEEYKK